MSTHSELDGFRQRLRSWIADAVPHEWRDRFDADVREASACWVSAVRDAGFGPPHWKADVGGPGLSLVQQLIVYEEFTLADCPRYPGLFSCAYTHVHDTLVIHGTPEQREAHLRPILDAERVWAQAFSEPEAGSDLASLRTTARRDGDEYVLNGQKTWSSLAPHADWAIALARTDASAPKRKGISYFLVDLRSPGVEIRPIKQITGAADDFAEVFFSDVRVPVENRVGEENDGWRVAQATLSAERGPLAVPTMLQMREAVATLGQDLLAQAGSDEDFAASELGRRFAQLHGEVEILAELMYGTLDRFIAVGEPGPESSIIKLYLAPLMRRITALGLEVHGLDGMVERSTDRRELPSGDAFVDHLGSWVWSIAGGTDQIQRTIVAERVLGLPRDPLVS